MGQGLLFSLFLRWGSHCWDRFAIYSFLLSWEVPAGTGLYMQLLARFRYCIARVTILCNQFGYLAALITIA